MISINSYDIDIARETRVAIRAEVERNAVARELRAGQPSNGWIARHVDPLLVRLGDRASAREANRGVMLPHAGRNGGSQPQGR